MNNFRDLKVWKKAVALATIVYEATDDFPNEEQYGLTNQIRRSVVRLVQISRKVHEGSRKRNSIIYSNCNWILL